MTFDELRERGILDKRPAALGPKFGGECEPELEAAYKRLWLGMEIVSWPNPPGFMGWFLKKIGRLTRQDGIDLLMRAPKPGYVDRLWKSFGPKPTELRFFYWRTALIGQYIVARNMSYIQLKGMDWLAEQDPLLFNFLTNFGRITDGEDLLALGLHFDVECRLGEPTSFIEVLQDMPMKELEEYINFPGHWDGEIQALKLREKVDA
ncbi:hypothetical protein [Pseudomonas sp. PLMAX]|uniref:hypothetical protein n=1 Tax=Pseudomonas sp. PLMAX TaxID=2201998 RepID=UPI0038BD6DAC